MNHESITRTERYSKPFAELQRLTLSNDHQLSVMKLVGASEYEIAAYNRQGVMDNSLIDSGDVVKHLTESQVLDYIEILADKE